MLKDTAASTNITIDGCTFWAAQADPYQRCVGGSSAGDPCRQECSNAHSLPGDRCNADADCGGTHFLDEIDVAPKRLIDVFGSPGQGDDYKVSGVYAFTDTAGNVFTLYDWEATSLFCDGLEEDDLSVVPTPAAKAPKAPWVQVWESPIITV
jgi:hypothetical protein